MSYTNGTDADRPLVAEFQKGTLPLLGWAAVGRYDDVSFWVGGDSDKMSRRHIEDYGGERFPIEVRRVPG